jgi:hypothetical protein
VQTDVRQVFHFHAGASSLGGFVEEPFRYIPAPCSASLSATGGSITTEHHKNESWEHEKIISWDKAHTHTSGRHVQRNGPWVERAVSVVEGLHILEGRITAKLVVAHLDIEHPASGGVRRISYAGSTIEGLAVDGKPVELSWNTSLLTNRLKPVDYYSHDRPIETDMDWIALGAIAQRHSSGFLHKDLPEWVQNRYGWVAGQANLREAGSPGYTLCSLVDKANGLSSPNQSFGHCIEIPDVGRIFLGESVIYPQAVSLTMIRAELGCDTRGQLDAGSTVANGSTFPPN